MITSKHIIELSEGYTPRYKVTGKYKDKSGNTITTEYSIRYEHPHFFVDVVYNGELRKGIWFSDQEKTCRGFISKSLGKLDKQFTRVN
jgi:hypothetical protein